MDIQEQSRQRDAMALAAKVVVGENHAGPVAIEPLGGMTNRNYLVTLQGQTYVVRIPGEGTEEYVDRKADGHAGKLTSELGVNAPLLYYNAAAGTQMTKFIDGSVTLSADLLQEPEAIRRTARTFRKLHTCGQKFLNDFDEKLVAKEYIEVLRSKNARIPEGYDRVQQEAEAIRAALKATQQDLVPCHNDPAPENMVDTGERVYILDWEFGGNNDPFWDLADLSVEARFTAQQDAVLLEAYLGRAPKTSEYGRIVLYKALAFLLWTLWGLLQEANQNPRPAYHFASYWDYAMDRFTHCQAIMNSAEFAKLLEAVRTGA